MSPPKVRNDWGHPVKSQVKGLGNKTPDIVAILAIARSGAPLPSGWFYRK